MKLNFSSYPLPDPLCVPYSIAAVPDGSVWFTMNKANRIGRITPEGKLSEFRIPTEGSGASIIAAARDCLYFTEYYADQIARIDFDGYIVEQPLPRASRPFGVTVGPDQSIWFTCMGTNKIGRIADDRIDFFNIPTPDSSPSFITYGSDGRYWFTENQGNQIGRLITDGGISIQEFKIPTQAARPVGISAGPDALWFAQISGNRIGRVDYSGNITEYPPLPVNSHPHASAVAPDGTAAFSLWGSNKIGCIPPMGGFFVMDIPVEKGEPHGLTFDSNGELWVALEAGAIGRFEAIR